MDNWKCLKPDCDFVYSPPMGVWGMASDAIVFQHQFNHEVNG